MRYAYMLVKRLKLSLFSYKLHFLTSLPNFFNKRRGLFRVCEGEDWRDSVTQVYLRKQRSTFYIEYLIKGKKRGLWVT